MDGQSNHKDNLGSTMIFMNILLFSLNFAFLGFKLVKGVIAAYKISREKGASGKIIFLNLLILPF